MNGDNDRAAPDPIMEAIDAMCADVPTSRRRLGLDAGLSDSAVKHIASGNSRSPKVETLARLAIAAGQRLYLFIGKRAITATLDREQAARRPIGPDAIQFSEVAAEVLYRPDEIEWVGLWRDMDGKQKARAIAVLRAVRDSDAA